MKNFDPYRLITPILLSILGYLIKYNFELTNRKLDDILSKQAEQSIINENIRLRVSILEKSDELRSQENEDASDSKVPTSGSVYYLKPDEIKPKNR